MSVIFMAGRKKRDMSKRKKIIRKAGYFCSDGVAKLTTGWEVIVAGTATKISFSRDNFHVWINSEPVETTAYISDEGYDVDLFFEIAGCHTGHIFSDVDNHRNEMINYLLVDDVCMGECYQSVHHQNTENKPNIKK